MLKLESRSETRETQAISMKIRSSFLLLFSSLLAACAYHIPSHFEQVKVGMEKNDVLSLMESPQRTQRWRGMDRWTYIYYDQEQRVEKEVHFSQGKATYVGEVLKPEVSAAERDQQNEASNLASDTQIIEQHKTSLDSFSRFEQTVKTEDQIRYVPQFEPVQ